MVEALLCLVVAVTDGDTIKVRCGSEGAYEQVKIRLSEIDAPEKKQPFGERSKQSLSDICFSKQATIKPLTKDRYGRTVARVICEGTDANHEQIQHNMAWVYDKYVTDKSLYTVQDSAKQAGRGLWADTAPPPPWEWRKNKK
jgi:endonuclease YncB( thermonuclease family)